MLTLRPIVVDDGNIVLGGNMRVKALQELGYKEIPDEWVKRASDLTDEQKKEFIIKDNVGYGFWDFEVLASDWDAGVLEDWGLEIGEFLQSEEEAEVKEDEWETPEEIQTDIVIGDLIEIGNHRLLCGDSTDSDQVAKLMDGQKPDMVFTDPPYGMNAVSSSGVLSKNYSEDILGDDNADAAKEAFNLIYYLYKDAVHIWWGANYYSSVLPDSECWIVWDKNNGQSDQTDCELAWSNARSVVRQFTQSSEKTNRVHPTQKPVSLVDWCVKRFANNSGVLCDFFLGSGSTMVACQQINRKCYGMELDPKYCQVIIDRMKKSFPELEVKINGVMQ